LIQQKSKNAEQKAKKTNDGSDPDEEVWPHLRSTDTDPHSTKNDKNAAQ
jgi:hypothetical protein